MADDEDESEEEQGLDFFGSGNAITVPVKGGNSGDGSNIVMVDTPSDGGDMTFIAGHRGESSNGTDGKFGTHGRITWSTIDGPTLILHGGDSEHMFTLERDGEILFSVPKSGPSDLIREIVQSEIRRTVAAELRQLVKQGLGAQDATKDASQRTEADLKEMGFDDDA